MWRPWPRSRTPGEAPSGGRCLGARTSDSSRSAAEPVGPRCRSGDHEHPQADGSLTQTALLLHLGPGGRAAELEPLISRTFRSMQSTSASALLMMSVDVVRSGLAVHGEERIGRHWQPWRGCARAWPRADGSGSSAAGFRESPDVVDIDPLRVVIDTRHAASVVTRPAPCCSTSTGSIWRCRPMPRGGDHRSRHRARCRSHPGRPARVAGPGRREPSPIELRAPGRP